MAHHHKHKVKIHHWKHGKLTVKEHEFDNLDSAMTFAINQKRIHENTIHETEVEQVIKVYDTEDDSLVESVGSSPQDPTYA